MWLSLWVPRWEERRKRSQLSTENKKPFVAIKKRAEIMSKRRWRRVAFGAKGGVLGSGSRRRGMREGFVEEVTSEMVLEGCAELSYRRIRGLAFQVFWENRKCDSSRRCEEGRWPGGFNRLNILRVLVSPRPLEGDAQRLFLGVQYRHEKSLYVPNLIFQSLLI